MPNDQDVYSGLLESFRKTLKETSKDDSNNCFMTESQASVVDFDAFKEFVARGCPHMPMSCDALYRHEDGTWFLIEFKNGKLLNKRGPDSQEFFKIIRKLFESLFLLTQKLKETIEFTKERLIFILVYNEENNGFLKTKDYATKLSHKNETMPMRKLSELLPDRPFNCSYFDKLYIKEALICSRQIFEREFVGRYLRRE